ncbi:MAG: BMP family ABC transporter substrate-binding protein [Spirochaetaceae bacterium]
MYTRVTALYLFALCSAFLLAPAAPGGAAGGRSADDTDLRLIAVFLPTPADDYALAEQVVAAAEAAAEEQDELEVRVQTLPADSEDPDAQTMSAAASDERVEALVVLGAPLIAESASVARAHPDLPVLLVDGATAEQAADRAGDEPAGEETATGDLSNMVSIRVNRREQAFLAGYIAGLRLLTLQHGAAVDPPEKGGLLLEETFPEITTVLESGYRLGLKAAASEHEIASATIPRDADAEEARAAVGELAEADIPVVLSAVYARRAAVLQAAEENELELLWLDDRRPESARDHTLAAIAADVGPSTAAALTTILEEGPEAAESVVLDFASGALTLNTDFDRFKDVFDEEERRRIEHMAERLRTGDLKLPM